MAISDQPKGARKKALDLLAELGVANGDVETALMQKIAADGRYAEASRKRVVIMLQLEDLTKRCMESYGSDEGK